MAERERSGMVGIVDADMSSHSPRAACRSLLHPALVSPHRYRRSHGTDAARRRKRQ
jgi:hypothetical protein